MEKAIGKVVKNPYAAKIVQDMTGEGLEEVIASAVNPALQSIYNGKTPAENYSKETLADMVYEGLIGAFLGGIGGSVSSVGRKVKGLPTGADVASQTASPLGKAASSALPEPSQEGETSSTASRYPFPGGEGELPSQSASLTAPPEGETSSTVFDGPPSPEGKAASSAFGFENPRTELERTVDRVAKALGLRVQYADQVLTESGKEANAKIVGNTVTIQKGNENPMSFLFGHEMMHHIRTLSEDAYGTVRKAVEGFSGFSPYVEAVKERYRENNVTLTEEDAVEEAVSDFAGRLIEDEELLQRFISENRERPSVLARIRDALVSLWQRLTGQYGDQQKIKRAIDAIDSAYRQAAQTAQENVLSGRLLTGREAASLREKYSFLGYDNETGKGIYEGNFPKGTPKAVKGDRILNLIQNVWSKNPIELVLKEQDGTERTIFARFDPEYDEKSGKRSDTSKLMGGNRHGTSSDQRVTLDLADDYHRILTESTHNYSKKETGKDTETHSGVSQWHYFVNNILYQEYGETKTTPYTVTIDVKERDDGNFVYSYHAEKQREGDSTRQTLHAAVTRSDEGADNAVPSGSRVPQSAEKVKTSSGKTAYDLVGEAMYGSSASQRMSQREMQEEEDYQLRIRQFDARYSAARDDGSLDDPKVSEKLMQEYDSLTEEYDRRRNLKNSSGGRIANKLFKEYGYGADRESVVKGIQELQKSVKNNTNWPKLKSSKDAAMKVAEEIVEGAVERDTELYDQFSELRAFLRETPILVSDEVKSSITDYADFRKRNMGKLKLVNGKQTNIDRVYEELREKYPGQFPEMVNVYDMLETMSDRMEEIYERPEQALYTDPNERKAMTKRVADAILRRVWSNRYSFDREGMDRRVETLANGETSSTSFGGFPSPEGKAASSVTADAVPPSPGGKAKGLPTGHYDHGKSFMEQLDDYEKGSFPERDTFTVGETPDVLRRIGLSDFPMVMDKKHISATLHGTYKGTDEEVLDHRLTKEELATVPEKMSHPVAVIQDKRVGKENASESVVDVIIEMKINGKQALIPVRVDGQGQQNSMRISANVISTVHGNKDTVERLVTAIEEDSDDKPAVFYIDQKKTIDLLQGVRNPIPERLSRINGYIHTIDDTGSPVKRLRGNLPGGNKKADRSKDQAMNMAETAPQSTPNALLDSDYHISIDADIISGNVSNPNREVSHTVIKNNTVSGNVGVVRTDPVEDIQQREVSDYADSLIDQYYASEEIRSLEEKRMEYENIELADSLGGPQKTKEEIQQEIEDLTKAMLWKYHSDELKKEPSAVSDELIQPIIKEEEKIRNEVKEYSDELVESYVEDV